ncbi:MAG: tetratricopeptide repeat protein, partial [Thermocrispum sp.]
LGVPPGPAIQTAMRERWQPPETVADEASIKAIIESASAAVSAGAGEAGVQALHTAVRLADGVQDADLRIGTRLLLAEALIHSIGGLDEQGLATLSEADRMAQSHDDRDAMARARAEIGYVDFLRGRYDRAERWLTDALACGQHGAAVTAKATTYLGAVASDRAIYPRAVSLLEDAITLSRRTGDLRREAYGLAMLGRVSLLRGRLDSAASQLDDSITLAERDHWLWFLPWPQALRGEVHLACNAPGAATEVLTQAFARACQFGDPCWEGMSARGLAQVAEATGATDRAFELLADARTRCNRLTDTYVWLDVHILDAQCELGRRHGHPQTEDWVDTMRKLASRSGMRELTVRSMLHAAALGNEGDAASAVLLGASIENPVLSQLLRQLPDLPQPGPLPLLSGAERRKRPSHQN